MGSLSDSVPGSFRDTAGVVFIRDGVVYRQVNADYRAEYDRLIGSGLYHTLARDGFLIPHREVGPRQHTIGRVYKVLEPEPIPFLSYPYEWCFGQLKDAALTTLAIQERALARGMSLKDASAFNIQFRGTAPLFIDTLSFESYREGRPWVAYRQFCEHFLAPLALMSAVDVRLGQLLRIHLDGIPLEMTSVILPARTRFKFSLFSHIHLHALLQRRFAGRPVRHHRGRMSLKALLGLIESLRAAVEGLTWSAPSTGWTQYDGEAIYSSEARVHKETVVREWLREIRPGVVWDLGANVGRFSRIAADAGAYAVAFDADHGATELNYRASRDAHEGRIIPLVLDVANPSPSVGWANAERSSWSDRGPTDVVLALALVHHLAITNNVPLARIAGFLARLARHLIIEFVPKDDAQAQRLLASRDDVYGDHSQAAFERAFASHFVVRSCMPVPASGRVLYLMRNRQVAT